MTTPVAVTADTAPGRRHDIDALRAIAFGLSDPLPRGHVLCALGLARKVRAHRALVGDADAAA